MIRRFLRRFRHQHDFYRVSYGAAGPIPYRCDCGAEYLAYGGAS